MSFAPNQRAQAHYDAGTSILVNLSQSSSVLQDLERALKHLRKATELDPSSAFAFHNLAHAYYCVAEYNVAVTQLKGFTANPQDSEKDISRALNLALDAANRALAIHYQFPQAHNTRAMILAKLLRLDEAMQATEVALSQAPDYTNAKENQEKIEELMRERAQVPGYAGESDFRKKIDQALTDRANVWKRFFKR